MGRRNPIKAKDTKKYAKGNLDRVPDGDLAKCQSPEEIQTVLNNIDTSLRMFPRRTRSADFFKMLASHRPEGCLEEDLGPRDEPRLLCMLLTRSNKVERYVHPSVAPLLGLVVKS